jgi:hypothetical protein
VISIKIDDDAVMAGEFVTGRVFWSGDRARRIIVAAVWETLGEANKARGVGRATEHVPRGAEETFPFRLLIPHEGPITFKGELTGIVWKLKVRVDQPGFDEFAEAEFRVTAGRRPRRSPG